MNFEVLKHSWKDQWSKSWENGKFRPFWVSFIIVCALSVVSYAAPVRGVFWWVLVITAIVTWFFMVFCVHYIERVRTALEVCPRSIGLGGRAYLPTPVAAASMLAITLLFLGTFRLLL